MTVVKVASCDIGCASGTSHGYADWTVKTTLVCLSDTLSDDVSGELVKLCEEL